MSHAKDDSLSDLFADAMQQVQPIKQTNKVISSTSNNRTKPFHDIHQRAKQPTYHSPAPVHSTLKEGASTWVLRANGIAPDTLKKLSSGQYPIDQTLDLHGMSQNQALQSLERFIQSSLQTSERILCIIHGRGLHSPDGQAVLKNSVYQWLKAGPVSKFILAVTPAPNTAGGACLVLLRRDKRT